MERRKADYDTEMSGSKDKLLTTLNDLSIPNLHSPSSPQLLVKSYYASPSIRCSVHMGWGTPRGVIDGAALQPQFKLGHGYLSAWVPSGEQVP